MEPNIHQFPTHTPKEKLSFDKIIRLIFITILILLVVTVGIMSFYIIKENKSQNINQDKQISIDTESLLNKTKLVFPKIQELIPSAQKDIPENMKVFILGGINSQTVNKIKYEDQRTGFNISYIVPDMTVREFISKLPKQILFTKVKSPWSIVAGANTNLVGNLDLYNVKTNVEARINFFLENKNVKVVIQSIDPVK